MDMTSYLLGKQAGGGGGESITDYMPNIVDWNASDHAEYIDKIKKLPTMTILNTVTSCQNLFVGLEGIKTVEFTSQNDTSNVTNMSFMFGASPSLETLDLSTFYTPHLTTISYMFYNDSSLRHIDMRNFTFDNVSSYVETFSSVHNNCEIIVKSQTEKNWFASSFPRLINVKTVEEYEAE